MVTYDIKDIGLPWPPFTNCFLFLWSNKLKIHLIAFSGASDCILEPSQVNGPCTGVIKCCWSHNTKGVGFFFSRKYGNQFNFFIKMSKSQEKHVNLFKVTVRFMWSPFTLTTGGESVSLFRFGFNICSRWSDHEFASSHVALTLVSASRVATCDWTSLPRSRGRWTCTSLGQTDTMSNVKP